MFKRLIKAFTPCPHLHVRETMACDAVCTDCGKNLGFIQAWRDANRGNKAASETPNDPRNWRPP